MISPRWVPTAIWLTLRTYGSTKEPDLDTNVTVGGGGSNGVTYGNLTTGHARLLPATSLASLTSRLTGFSGLKSGLYN